MRHSETGEDETAIETVADAGGVAIVPAKSLGETKGNPRFIVAADGSGVTVQPVSAGDANPTIRLSRAGSVTVTFLGPDGKAVPGLWVEPKFVIPSSGFASFAGFAMIPPSLKRSLVQKTDANGTVRFSGFSLAQRVHLEIPDERFAALEVMNDDITLSQAGDTPPKTVRLVLAGSIRGQVLFGSSGKPVVGITVGAQGVDLPGAGESAITDDRGLFVLRQLRPAQYDLALDLAKAGLDKDWTGVAYDSLPVAAGQQLAGKDFTLIPGVVVRGTAVDSKTGAAIAGAQIGIYGPAHPKSGAWVQSVSSDSAGAFTARVPAGKQYIYPMSVVDGHVGPSPQEPIAVEGQPLIVRLAYSPNIGDPPAVGHVVGADGTPAAGAMVLADRPGAMEPLPQAITDAAGQFRFAALPDGTPIPNAKVELVAEMLGLSTGDEPPTDAQGNYTFSELYQDQAYELVVMMEGFNVYQTTLHPKRSRGLKQTKKITLVPATGTISGSVIKDAVARAGVRIELRGGWQDSQTTTDAGGRFRFEHVEVTNILRIRAVADWGTSAWQSVGDGTSDVRISFDP
jgi:uncharacterized GH25 family protein